jgi:ABC-type dipeptide/oligopeptide/nickel transport system permease component
MVGFLLRRIGIGLVALFVGLSGSYFFWTSRWWPKTPLLHGYWGWLRGVFNLNSLRHGLLPVPSAGFGPPGTAPADLWSYVGAAFGRTLLMLALTLVIVLVVAIPLGALAASRRGSAVDLLLRVTSYAAWAVPGFLLATILQEAAGSIPGGWGVAWFPEAGWAGECPNGMGTDPHNFQCPAAGTGLNHIGLVLYHLALPAIALALGFIGLHARYLRNALVEALDAPHITVARAKGLTERAVLYHALRRAGHLRAHARLRLRPDPRRCARGRLHLPTGRNGDDVHRRPQAPRRSGRPRGHERVAVRTAARRRADADRVDPRRTLALVARPAPEAGLRWRP